MKKALIWMWESHKSQYPYTKGGWIVFIMIFLAMLLLLVNVLDR